MHVPADLVLLRPGMLPEVALRPGTFLHGRVVDPKTLLLEGVRLAAELPDDVEAGQVLRLRVEDTGGADRLHLRVVERPEAPQAPQQVAPPPVAIPLPGGAQLLVEPDGGEGTGRRGERSVAMVVRYDSPVLGRLDVRLEPGAAAVHVSAGEPAAAVREASGVLRDALAGATGRPTQVTVHPRQATLDVSA